MDFSFQKIKILSKIFKIIGFVLLSLNIYSQDIILFENVAFCKPFISDTRSPYTKLEIGYLNKLSPYYYNDNFKSRPFTETHLGYNLNIFSYKNNKIRLAFSLPGGINNTDRYDGIKDGPCYQY